MKPLLIVITALQVACSTTVTTRPLPEGGSVTTTEKGLTEAARGVALGAAVLAGDIARVRAGVPVERGSK